MQPVRARFLVLAAIVVGACTGSDPKKPELVGPGNDVESARVWSNYFSCLVEHARSLEALSTTPENIATMISHACNKQREDYKADRLSRYKTENEQARQDFAKEVDEALSNTALYVATKSQQDES